MNTIAVINVARTQLGMDEQEMRALYVRVTGINSLRAMTERQRISIVDELKRCGFVVRPGKKMAAKLDKIRPAANRPHCRYIHALWKSCARYSVIDDSSVKALNRFCKKFVAPHDDKIAVDVDFLSKEQADPVISALKAMENRGRATAS